jgi:hypothetical protein
MERRTLGLTGVLLGLGALVRIGASDGSRTKTPDHTAAPQLVLPPSPGCGGAEDGPWRALAGFFDLQVPAGKDNPWGVPGTKPEFLVATVPDPIRTHLALDFDRAVESIIWAAGDSEFSFQRHWTPWRITPEKDLPLLADRECQKLETEQRNKQPGMLAFQKRQGPSLLVFLVGESPTSGVNQEQLSNAVRYIRGLSGNPHGDVTIGVVGPSFSGSLSSLASNLAVFPAFQCVQFHFASGMVTSAQAIDDFRNDIRNVGGAYDSTIETDKRAMELFFGYVQKIWHSQPRVALLTEEETAYGKSIQAPDSFRAVGGWQHRWLTMRYPREISRLRNAYQEESGPAAKGSQQRAEPAPSARRFTLKDAGSEGSEAEKDAVPAFSPLQSPASQEAVMSGIADTVRRERADFVGIAATDVLDALFLSRYLRAQCPDSRLFTPDADVLFSADSAGDSLEGMLAITTYPLFSRNQHWTSKPNDEDQRIQFASRYAQGVYNACRHLLDPEARLKEYTRPGEDKTRPPLWLTVMGRDGYWPLALLDESDRGSKALLDVPLAKKPMEAIHPEAPSRGWFLCFWLSALFSILHGLFIRCLIAGEGKPDKAGMFYSILSKKLFSAYPEPGDELSDDQRVFLTAAALSAGCAVFIVVSPLVPFIDWSRPTGWMGWYFGIGALAVLIQFLAAGELCRRRSIWYHIPEKKLFPPPNTALLAGGLWALAAYTVAVWLSLVKANDYRSGYFLSYRCFGLTNGVAPNVPILLLAGGLFYWALMQLTRVARVDRRTRMRNAVGKTELPGEWLMKAVDRSLEELFATSVWLPALSIPLVWALLFVPWRTMRSFEFARFDWLLIAVLGAVYWAMAVTWMQFLWCWNEFKGFLQWLERQPIRGAFSRLRKEISWVPLVSKPPEHPLFVSSRAWDCLRALRSFDGSKLKDSTDRDRLEGLKLSIQSESKKIEDILESLDKQLGKGIDDKPYDELQRQFQSAAAKIVRDLEGTSWSTGDSDSLEAEHEKRARKKDPTADERLVILKEEFVAFRYLMFIRYVFRSLRNLLGFIIVAFILSVISLSSYPLQGHRWIGVASAITFVALGTGIAIVFAGMDRDAILSRISATKPNEVGLTFYLRLAQFGALPLLTVVASQFPSVNRFLFAWVQPALEALK